MTDAPAGDRNAILCHWLDAVLNIAWRISSATRTQSGAPTQRRYWRSTTSRSGIGHSCGSCGDRDGLTQKELSDAIGVTEPTTFAAVKALIDKGYITRRHNTGNKRKFYVYLTSEGRRCGIFVPLAEKVNRVAVADIPLENINLMRETLLKMIENLAAEDENGG